MNVFTAGLFMIAGCFRRSHLSDLSRGQLFCGELSRLFRFKLSLWIMLVLIDFVVFVYIYVQTFQKEVEVENNTVNTTIEHLKLHKRTLLISVLAVEALNLLAYIFAAYLLFYEHVRKMREAWFTHKFFVWANFILGCAHMACFWPIYDTLIQTMCIIRQAIFLMLMIAQCFMENRHRLVSQPNSDNFILRSSTSHLEEENSATRKSSAKQSKNDNENELVYTGIQLHVKIQSLKRHYQSFSLSIQTQVRCLPERLPGHILNRLQRRIRKTTVAPKRSGAAKNRFNEHVDDNFMPADQLLEDNADGNNEFLIRRSMTTVTADHDD